MSDNRELYVVYYESANYCGYGEHALVWASSEDDALYNDELAGFAEDHYFDQDSEQYEEEHGEDNYPDVWATIKWAVPLKGSEYEKYVNDPSQSQFYPIVNFK